MEKIELPIEVSDLLDKSIFEQDDISEDYLARYLFYMPEVVRIFDLAVAAVKEKVKKADLAIWKIETIKIPKCESRVLLGLSSLDSHKYRNEQMRRAKIVGDEEYLALMQELLDVKKLKMRLEGESDEIQAHIWKYRNLSSNLDTISKLRISQRRY